MHNRLTFSRTIGHVVRVYACVYARVCARSLGRMHSRTCAFACTRMCVRVWSDKNSTIRALGKTNLCIDENKPGFGQDEESQRPDKAAIIQRKDFL